MLHECLWEFNVNDLIWLRLCGVFSRSQDFLLINLRGTTRYLEKNDFLGGSHNSMSGL